MRLSERPNLYKQRSPLASELEALRDESLFSLSRDICICDDHPGLDVLSRSLPHLHCALPSELRPHQDRTGKPRARHRRLTLDVYGQVLEKMKEDGAARMQQNNENIA